MQAIPSSIKGALSKTAAPQTVSADASGRAHRALQYLMDNQGLSFRKLGLNIVAWDVQTGAISVPLNESDSAQEEDEDNVELPDTFEKIFSNALRGRKRKGTNGEGF